MADTHRTSLQLADEILALFDERRATARERATALEIARIVVDEAKPQSPTALRAVSEAPGATA